MAYSYPNRYKLNLTPSQPVQAPKPIAQPKITQPRPVESITRNPAPINTPVKQPDRKYMQGSLFNKAIDLVSTPSYAVGSFLSGTRQKAEQLSPQVKAGKENKVAAIGKSLFSGIKNLPSGISKRYSVSDYLGKDIAGSKMSSPITKKIASNPAVQFAGEVVIPAIPLGKVASKLAPVTKKIGEVTKISSVADKIKNTPLVTGIVSKFVKGYGLADKNKSVVDILDEIPTEYAKKAEAAIEKRQELFGKTPSFLGKLFGQKAKFSKEQIEAVPKFLEPKGAGAPFDLGKLKKDLGTGFDKLKPVLKQEKKISKEQIYDAVKQGVMDGETAKRLLKQGGYFPHTFEKKSGFFSSIGSKLGVKQGYLKKRKGAEGFSYNAPKALTIRELGQAKDDVVRGALKQIKTQFGVKVGKGQSVPEGYVAFLDDTRKGLQELKGHAVPKDVAEYLNQTLHQSGPFGKIVDKFNRIWKPTATSVNPAFHLTNIMGNVYNSWLGGVKNPKRFLQMAAGNFSKQEKEIVKKAGILSKGQFGGDVAERYFGDDAVFGAKTYFKGAQKLGEKVENNARSALFLDAYEKLIKDGLPEQEAIQGATKTVNKFLFDYINSLTPFERNVVKRAFPFYTWMKNNVPLQLDALVNQTEKVKNVAAAYRVANQGDKEAGDRETDMTFPTGRKDEFGSDLRYRPNLPLQDIFNASPKTRVIDALNPLFKEVPQLALFLAGKLSKPEGNAPFVPIDLFTNRERTKKDVSTGEQVKDIAGSEVLSTLRPVRSYQRVTDDSSMSSILRTLIGGFYKPQSESSKTRLQIEKNRVRDNTLLKRRKE